MIVFYLGLGGACLMLLLHFALDLYLLVATRIVRRRL